MQPIFLISKL